MSMNQKLWLGLSVLLACICAIAFVSKQTRARFHGNPSVSGWTSRTPTAIQPRSTSVFANSNSSRNLMLQREAFNMARLLGKRFSQPTKSTLIATVTVGSNLQAMQITRTPIDNGERVEIAITGAANLLTWDATQGPLSSTSPATASNRELIERLVFDSPDQFILAQLRGVSYYTVARNVRPADVKDDSSGPLWNIVRLEDPESDSSKRPQSRWRLYYVNAATGLVDRIVSEIQGVRVTAQFSKWLDLNGEKQPGLITWSAENQVLMQYALTTASVVAEQGAE